MTDREAARTYIAAMVGNRQNLTDAERDILHQLLDTPAARNRFPMFTADALMSIADGYLAESVAPPRRRRRVG